MPITPLTCPACQVAVPQVPGKPLICPACGLTLSPSREAPQAAAWYYARDRQKCGPVSLAELRRLARLGQLQPGDMVLQTTASKWTMAKSIPGLFPESGPSAIREDAVVRSAEGEPGDGSPRPFGKRLLGEVAAVCLAPITQMVRLLHYARARRRLRRLTREHREARFALGQRTYETGAGDSEDHARIAALDEEICRLEAARQSPRTQKAERQQLILQLADQTCAQSAPPRTIEVAHGRARDAGEALCLHEQVLARTRQDLLPRGAANWARVVGGYGLAWLLLIGIVYLVLPTSHRSEDEPAPSGQSKGEPTSPRRTDAVIAGTNRERELGQAVGWVLCGGTITRSDGTQVERCSSFGSCFAVSADGYLLTNKHVVKTTWEELTVEARKRAIDNLARRLGVTATPMVWVFFGGEKYVGRISYVSPTYDLAIVKVERHSAPFFRLLAADSPPRGTKVVACGFPGATRIPLSDGENLAAVLRKKRMEQAMRSGKQVRVEEQFKRSDFEFDMTTGSVSRPVTEDNGCKWIQHGAAIHGGNSGGPLLTEDGTVVGINTLKLKTEAGVQWSLSLPQLRPEIDKYVPGVIWK